MVGDVIFAESFGFFLDDGLVDGVIRGRLVCICLIGVLGLDHDHISLMMYYVMTDYLHLSLEVDCSYSLFDSSFLIVYA